MRLRAASPVALLLALLTSTSVPLAQPAPAEIEAAKKAAAAAADKAFDDYTNGRYEQAIAGFQKADGVFHTPKFRLYVARAQAKAGRLVQARATYESIVKEQIPGYAPTEVLTAQADAKKELADLTKRIPSLVIETRGDAAQLTLDGKPAAAGSPIALDPGEHTIAGSAPGGRRAEAKITVKAGETRRALLDLSAPPEPPPTAAADPTAGAATPPDPPSRRPPTATYAAYGAGLVGLLAGATFAGVAFAKKGEYDAARDRVPLDATAVNGLVRDGRAFSLAADIGFAVALAGAAAGTVLWIVTPRAPEKDRSQTSVFLRPAAGGVFLGGSF